MTRGERPAKTCENGEVSNTPEAPEPAASEQDAPEPVVTVTEEKVEVIRSVRFGRIIVGGAVLGAAVAALVTLSFPVVSQDYTMGQVVGFMSLIGAGIGLGVGGALSLILARVAARRYGTAVAKHSDVG